MRIWAFPSFYPYDHPGKKWLGIFAHRQNKGLIQNGADLKVVVPVLWAPPAPFHQLNSNWKMAAEVRFPVQREYDGITVYHPRIKNMKPSRIFKRPYAERYADAIVSFFKENNITLNANTDIFYSQWLPDSVMVQNAAHRLGVKSAILAIGDDVIVWPHNNERTLNLFKKVWQEADMRLAVAGYLAKEGNKLLGKDMPYEVVRRGVEYDRFHPVSAEEKLKLRKELGLPADKTILLTIGTALVRKGWLDLFDALKNVRNTHKDILLVGVHAGTPDIKLDEEAAKRGLTDIFLNMGEVDPKKVNQLYQAADIFCLPSHWEGIANAVVEAMSSGLPTLTTNVSGHPELVTNGQTGVMVPPKQPGQIEKELLKMLDDKAYRDSLGTNAREFIVTKWGSFADNAALLYKKLSNA